MPTLRLRLSPAAEKAVRQGHPWVFSDSVRDQSREGAPGELAIIYGRDDRFLAAGFYDPASPIRVRIVHAGKPAVIDAAWWRARLDAALEKRRGLFAEDTTGWRVIHGESDGFPGLVLDHYAGTLVLKLYTAAWLPRLPELLALFTEKLAPVRIVLRLSRNITETARRDYQAGEGCLQGSAQDTVIFTEHGLRFEAAVRHGQKTGFFLDQRENRQRVRALAHGATVLNAFSFSGAFSVYAAAGGAARVADLDMSLHALAAGARNMALNPAAARCPRDEIQADAFAWLAQTPRARWDLIIVDPPSLAKREADRPGAITAYTTLYSHALRHLRPGGVLVAASCSAHVSMDEFLTAVRHAAAPYHTTELWTAAHAPDHAVTFREAAYLKCTALRVTG